MIATGVRARVLGGFEDPGAGEAQWGRLLAAGETDAVFLTREWQRLWWEVFGRGELLLVAAERGGEVVALAPLYADEGMIYFIGSGFESYRLGIIGEAGEPEVVEALLDAARRAVSGFAGFELYFVGEDSALEAAAERLGLTCSELWSVPVMTLGLAGQPEAALAVAGKKSLMRPENGLRREGELRVRHWREAGEVLPQLDDFFAQHQERWGGGQFAEGRWREFYRRWAVEAGRRGWLRFTRVEWGGEAVAYHYGMSYGGSYFWYKPSFAPRHARRSPGEVLLRQLLLAAIEEESRTFDFGIGEEAFKYRFADRINRVRTWGLYPK